MTTDCHMPPSQRLLAALSAAAARRRGGAQDRDLGGFSTTCSAGEGHAQPVAASSRRRRRRSRGRRCRATYRVRLDRIENQLRQLTGTIEQLQYPQPAAQQAQLKRMQDDAEACAVAATRHADRLARCRARHAAAAPAAIAADGQPPCAARSDVFDPVAAARTRPARRARSATTPSRRGATARTEPPIAAPDGGRDAGAPLDLSTLPRRSGPAAAPAAPPGDGASQPPRPRQRARRRGSSRRCRRRRRRRTNTIWPTAMCCARITRWPSRPSAISARSIANELLCRTRNTGSARACSSGSTIATRRKSFLAVSTKYDAPGKAPESLLRLGQSLAALKQKEAACATLAEVGRKYPNASASVKRGVAQEQKRASMLADPEPRQKRRSPRREAKALFADLADCPRWCSPFPAGRIRPRCWCSPRAGAQRARAGRS